MKLVIDISDDVYQTILATHDNMIFDSDNPYVAMAIKNGTPLPKGHGRLIDEKDLSLMTVHMIDGMFVCNAPTIIEADKESKESEE